MASPSVRAGLLVFLLLTAANETVNLVFGLWLEQRFNFQLAALGAAAVLIGVSEMGGEGLSAWLVDRLGKVWSVRAGLLVNLLAAVVMYGLGGQAWGALAGLFLFYLSFEFSLVSLLPLMSETLPELRATVMAGSLAMGALGRALGTQLAPLLFNGVGMGGNLLAALAMNLLAIWLVQRVRCGRFARPVKRLGTTPDPSRMRTAVPFDDRSAARCAKIYTELTAGMLDAAMRAQEAEIAQVRPETPFGAGEVLTQAFCSLAGNRRGAGKMVAAGLGKSFDCGKGVVLCAVWLKAPPLAPAVACGGQG
ncbi:MAG: hypothetical protein KatS3mg045_0330 [Bellilinea sp.]|nr:MAG: hypothetical protein KatS3mg045_0330 [Bellilinea sp.]